MERNAISATPFFVFPNKPQAFMKANAAAIGGDLNLRTEIVAESFPCAYHADRSIVIGA